MQPVALGEPALDVPKASRGIRGLADDGGGYRCVQGMRGSWESEELEADRNIPDQTLDRQRRLRYASRPHVDSMRCVVQLSGAFLLLDKVLDSLPDQGAGST